MVDGATAPGTQDFSAAMIASGFLMPRRLVSGVSPWISAAAKAASAGCGGACRALVGHRDMRQRVDQLPGEVVLRALHQRRHHDRKANSGGDTGHRDEGLARTGADMGECDVEDQFMAKPDCGR